MEYSLRKQSLLLINMKKLITWQTIVVNHSQREAMGTLEAMDMPKQK